MRHRPSRVTLLITILLATVGAGAGVTWLSLWSARGTIAGYLALLLPLVLPGMLVTRRRLTPQRLLMLGAVIVGLLLGTGLASDLPFVDRLRVWGVLTAWMLGVAGLCLLANPRARGRREGRGVVGTTVAGVVALFWLTGVVWLGPTMAERGWDVPLSVSALHPVFVVNAAASVSGIWTQQPIAYGITPLGQGVDYALPDSVWPFVVVHGLVFILALGVRNTRKNRRRKPL